jgi:hypothetical protein
MKKIVILFVVITSFVLTSCGSGSTTNEVSDSTNVVVDTTSTIDTTVLPIETGGGSVGDGENTDGKEVKPSELPIK